MKREDVSAGGHVKNSRKNLRIGIIEGFLSTPYSVAVVPGSFIIAALLTQWFGIGKSSFGWIVSMPSWTNVLQAALLPFLARGITPKGLVLGMGWFNVALWAVMAALIGFLPRNGSHITIGFFLVFFFFRQCKRRFSGCGMDHMGEGMGAGKNSRDLLGKTEFLDGSCDHGVSRPCDVGFQKSRGCLAAIYLGAGSRGRWAASGAPVDAWHTNPE